MEPIAEIYLNYFVWDVDPEIFVISAFGMNLPLRYYGLFFMISFLVGFKMVYMMYQKEGKDVKPLDSLLNYMLFGTIIGARLGHCFFYQPEFFMNNPVEILMVHKGGLASHGGLIGILISLFIFVKRNPGTSYIWLIDRLALPSAFAAFMIRMGNFFNSEIVGNQTDVPWAIIFKRLQEGDPTVPRHPTMLYEAFSYLITFIVLILIYKKESLRSRQGLMVGVLMILVFVSRFICEFTKMKQEDFGSTWALNMGHFLSIPFVLFGFVLLVQSKNKIYPVSDQKPPAKNK